MSLTISFRTALPTAIALQTLFLFAPAYAHNVAVRVMPGDTMSSLMLRSYIGPSETRARDIVAYNNLRDERDLRPGSVLLIPYQPRAEDFTRAPASRSALESVDAEPDVIVRVPPEPASIRYQEYVQTEPVISPEPASQTFEPRMGMALPAPESTTTESAKTVCTECFDQQSQNAEMPQSLSGDDIILEPVDDNEFVNDPSDIVLPKIDD